MVVAVVVVVVVETLVDGADTAASLVSTSEAPVHEAASIPRNVKTANRLMGQR